MKEKIEQLSRGEFVYDLPTLLLTEEEIYITVESGSTQNGSVTVYNSMNVAIKGVLYSSSSFIKLEATSFVGEANTIHFTVNAAELEAGEDLITYIDIVKLL